MASTSNITISDASFATNLAFLRGFFPPEVRISSVVKGNAYGHGINEFIPMAESQGLDHFSVHSADEAREVFEAKRNNSTEIMIMGFLDSEDMPWVIENDISFFVFDFERLSAAIQKARSLSKKARIHIELETGMNRTGFGPTHLERLVQSVLDNTDHLIVEGICTHFAGAESIANYLRIQSQKDQFMEMTSALESMGVVAQTKHTCCSAASIRLPDMHFDMVRIGILQYGFWPSREIFIDFLKGKENKEDPLRRVIEWKTSVMNLKEVAMGEFIGYGTTYQAQRDMQIAIVPVGYSHGFSRSLSNQGRVIVGGIRVPVIGIVNMNNMAIDVTDVPEVKIGDPVILIGKHGDAEISVSSFSELSDQLNYELLTRLPSKIPRKVT
ncbi:MAG: alanine racemase [Cyclobacteriaceae bacterium]